ncbi:hypothetical protein ACTWP4_15335 [Gracilibacillus sp. D59]|uniref:hypothetical protein n=1 Tax=Gracilibacillus sp. D59 TaxID=3457434 RepID=UPI003FCD7821
MIGLPLTILFTIFVFLFFFFQRKRYTFIENSIVYMVMTIITTNVITILTLNLELIKTTENPFLFPAVLLYRNVIIPLLILYLVNAFHTSYTLKRKTLYFILIFTCLNGIEALLIFMDVFKFIKWNYFKAAIVNCAFLFIGLGIAKIVVFVSKRSSN